MGIRRIESIDDYDLEAMFFFFGSSRANRFVLFVMCDKSSVSGLIGIIHGLIIN